MVPHARNANIQNALKANGVFIKISPADFQNMLNKQDILLIVLSKSGLFSDTFLYLTSHRGFVFYCKSKEQLTLPSRHEMIYSSSVTLPIAF